MRALGCALIAALLLSACRAGSTTTRDGVQVMASFYPLAEFARRIGGERVQVRTLVPPGVEPHDYEPGPQDLAALLRADVIVYNGAGFEPWIGRVVPESRAVAIEASAGLPLIAAVAPGHDGNRTADPHVWLDPVLAAGQAQNILTGLIRTDPDGRRVYEANAARLVGELHALHGRYEQRLRACRQRTFITTHAAFGYLARRYGLRQIPIGGLTPEAEPSPRRMQELVEQARKDGVRIVFTEPLTSSRVALALAREIGGSVRPLNPLEGLTTAELQQGKTYFTVMHENLNDLAAGLQCR